jgi:hypothetical protein
MITKILILLVIVTVIAVITTLVGSSKGGVPETLQMAKEDPLTAPVTPTEALGDSMATLTDRAIAATQYQMLEDSFNKHCPEDAMTEDVKKTFRHMASHLATIGTNVDPNEVLTPVKDGVPPGWDLN